MRGNNFNRIKYKIFQILKKAPVFVVSYSFLFFVVFFVIEIIIGAWLYHFACFPQASKLSSSFPLFERKKIAESLEKISEREKERERIGQKEYFDLFNIKIEQETSID